MPWKVFWCEPSGLAEIHMRRYYRSREHRCSLMPGEYSRHEWKLTIHEQAPENEWHERVTDTDGSWHWKKIQEVADDDPRWPTHCACGFEFPIEDGRYADGDNGDKQTNVDELYSGHPDGQLYTWREMPVGAMRNCLWLTHGEPEHSEYVGPDGIALTVKTPGGEWMIDSQCSNCTRNQWVDIPDKEGWKTFTRTHWCWVRHGDPRTGHLHVDKNGNTCEAGGGSIICGNYHGFLHNGYLTDSL
jgi:hypothetical protein